MRREYPNWVEITKDLTTTLREAGDEINRLRAENARLLALVEFEPDLQAALNGEPKT